MKKDKFIENEEKRAFIDVLEEEHGGLYAAASDLGIPMSRVRKWRKEDPDFDAQVKETIDTEVRWVEYKLHDLIEADNVQAITFFLRTKGKDYGYQETSKQEVAVQSIDVSSALEELASQVSGS